MGRRWRGLVSDELWELIEPLIPKVRRRYRYPGRKRLDDCKVLSETVHRLERVERIEQSAHLRWYRLIQKCVAL
jgi:transposase